MDCMGSFFLNVPLIAALVAIIFAQIIKVPIHLIFAREFAPGLVFGTGSMPSSHSAAVSGLTTCIGLIERMSARIFAGSFVFSVIIMFGATGIRREAGEHVVILHQVVRDFRTLFEEATDWNQSEEYEKIAELKTLLGHKPIEVFVGALTGIAIAFLLQLFY